MKTFFTFLLLSITTYNFAQETIETNNDTDNAVVSIGETTMDQLHFDTVWRLYYVLPNQIGNSVYAEAYDAKFSLGTSFGLLEYSNFKLSVGFEFEQYNITDVSKASNFDFISKYAFFGIVSYDFHLGDNIMVVPQIGYGSSDIHHKMRSERVANQGGTHFRVGCFGDYSLGNNFAFFIGIHYINSTFDVSTNDEFKKYFEKSNQLQLTLGIKVY